MGIEPGVLVAPSPVQFIYQRVVRLIDVQLRFPTCYGRSWSHTITRLHQFSSKLPLCWGLLVLVFTPTSDPQWAQIDRVRAKSFPQYTQIDSLSYRLLSHIGSFFHHFPVHGPLTLLLDAQQRNRFWLWLPNLSCVTQNFKRRQCDPMATSFDRALFHWILLRLMESGSSKTTTPT